MRTRRTHGRRPWYGVALLAGLVVGLVVGALVLQTPRLSLEAAEYVAAVADLYAREGNLDQARAWLAEARLTSRRDLQALRIALATAHPERTESLRALDALIEALQRSEGVPLWQRALPILAGLAVAVGLGGLGLLLWRPLTGLWRGLSARRRVRGPAMGGRRPPQVQVAAPTATAPRPAPAPRSASRPPSAEEIRPARPRGGAPPGGLVWEFVYRAGEVAYEETQPIVVRRTGQHLGACGLSAGPAEAGGRSCCGLQAWLHDYTSGEFRALGLATHWATLERRALLHRWQRQAALEQIVAAEPGGLYVLETRRLRARLHVVDVDSSRTSPGSFGRLVVRCEVTIKD